MKRTFQLSVTAAIVSLCAAGAFSQTPNRLSLAIGVEQTTFHQTQSAKVQAKINWGPVPGARLNTLRTVSFQLTKSEVSATDCTRGDCFFATYALSSSLVLKNGELSELDVDLNELYWVDLTSSHHDLNRPKNMAKVIQPGGYVLSMSVSFPAKYSTRRGHRMVETTSNLISIQIK